MNKAIDNLNESETQLFSFLQNQQDTNNMDLYLYPQGDNTIIQKEAVNLCMVEINNHRYQFGGIREEVYDHFVKLYKNQNN